MSFLFEWAPSSCFSFRLLALSSLRELAITPADIRCHLTINKKCNLENAISPQSNSDDPCWELWCRNYTDCVWSLILPLPPSIRIRAVFSSDFRLQLTRLIACLEDEYHTRRHKYFLYLGHPGVYQRSDLRRGKVRWWCWKMKWSLNSSHLAPAISRRGGESCLLLLLWRLVSLF